MSDLVRALGVGPRVFFDGRECVVRARGLELDAMIHAEILKSRGDPFQQAIESAANFKTEDGKPNDDWIRALADASLQAMRRNRNVSWSEHMAYVDTLDGKALEVWYCLRGNFGHDWSVSRVKFVLAESMRLAFSSTDPRMYAAWTQWRDELQRAMDIAGGEDLLGNLTGLQPIPLEAETVQSQVGEPLSGDSARDQTEKFSGSPAT